MIAAFEAWVTALCFSRGTAYAALGDGSVRALSATGWSRTDLHRGAVLAMAPHPLGGVATGGDDGALLHLSSAGEVVTIARFPRAWVDPVVAWSGGQNWFIAAAAGREAVLFDAGGERRRLPHPSTVTGLAVDAKGKRLAASHVDGASLWFAASRDGAVRPLAWKGSHVAVAIHPAGEAVVTAMQENALHGWRLEDDHDMRMSGYPAKPESLGFTPNGKWLASSGADAVVLWPFFGGGPMGKPPLELAGREGVLCTRVSCHPRREIVAAGYADGGVVVADIASRQWRLVAAPEASPISALAWDEDGARLAFGAESGRVGVIAVGDVAAG